MQLLLAPALLAVHQSVVRNFAGTVNRSLPVKARLQSNEREALRLSPLRCGIGSWGLASTGCQCAATICGQPRQASEGTTIDNPRSVGDPPL